MEFCDIHNVYVKQLSLNFKILHLACNFVSSILDVYKIW